MIKDIKLEDISSKKRIRELEKAAATLLETVNAKAKEIPYDLEKMYRDVILMSIKNAARERAYSFYVKSPLINQNNKLIKQLNNLNRALINFSYDDIEI